VRLSVLDHKHPLGKKVQLFFMGLMFRGDSPFDVLKMLWHRPLYFGRPFVAMVQRALRGPSEWSVGERELFAAFVSQQNVCPFCEGSHAAVAFAAGDRAAAAAVLRDWRGAKVDPKVSAVLVFLEKMTREPGALAPSDADAVRAAGVSQAALEDAITIGFLFNVINRIANAMDFHVPSPDACAKTAPFLIKKGYPQ
jgi:uncharacterized peroxidase-related enzyme